MNPNTGYEIRRVGLDRRRDRSRFIDVPFHLYPRSSPWVPPLRLAVARILDQTKNPFYESADIVAFIAMRGRRPIGRVAAIVNRRHNEFHADTVGFFGFFECIDDEGVAHALLDAAADWLRAKGMTAMRGPVSPSTNDECGLLVDAFESPPIVMMPYNPPYYAHLLESYGLVKAKDLYAYSMSRDDDMSAKIFRVARIAERRAKATLRPMDVKHVEAEMAHVRDLYTRGWERNWGFVPMTDAELDFAAADMKEAVAPGCAFFAEVDGQPVGFALALLDLNQVFRRIRSGRLLPFGILTFLRHKPKIDWIRVILLGVVPEWRGRGIDAMFYEALWDASKYTGGEFSWVLEDNHAMRDVIEAFGGHHYKTYRIYDVPLKAGPTPNPRQDARSA